MLCKISHCNHTLTASEVDAYSKILTLSIPFTCLVLAKTPSRSPLAGLLWLASSHMGSSDGKPVTDFFHFHVHWQDLSMICLDVYKKIKKKLKRTEDFKPWWVYIGWKERNQPLSQYLVISQLLGSFCFSLLLLLNKNKIKNKTPHPYRR